MMFAEGWFCEGCFKNQKFFISMCRNLFAEE